MQSCATATEFNMNKQHVMTIRQPASTNKYDTNSQMNKIKTTTENENNTAYND